MEQFLTALSGASPTPGGGGAAALAGALAASLASMVASLTSGKKKYAAYQAEIEDILARTAALRDALYSFIARDAEAFEPLSRAYGIPKGTPGREEVLEAALHAAAETPLALLETLCALPPICERLLTAGSRLAVSDAGCAAALCRAAAECAALNVYINTKLMRDADLARALNTRTDAALAQIGASCTEVYDAVRRTVKGEKA